MSDDPAPRHTRRATALIGVGMAGLLCWVAAAAMWVSWAPTGAWLAARAGWIAPLLVLLGMIGAGGWSWAQRAHGDRPSGRARPRPALSWWVVAGALFLVVVVSWGATSWLLHVAATANDVAAAKVDAIKAGLGIGAGTGGVFALLLAVRRQWHQELSAADTVLDATERRVTELYTKAADQLGSDKAPVRLAGLYALERLAQANVEHRQTVVNVLCAYLRMPYQPPEPPPPPASGGQGRSAPARPRGIARPTVRGVVRAAATTAVEDSTAILERERLVQEREVRLTAQRILTEHLRPGPDCERPADTFWQDRTIDLTGAVLVDFDMEDCQLITAMFDGATFAGGAVFARATFAGDAVFARATFTEYAVFAGATFAGGAVFARATFAGDAVFARATFAGNAGFREATFAGDAEFAGATFTEYAMFDEATFAGRAVFARATFTEYAMFREATFTEYAGFREATFTEYAVFDEATFAGRAVFARATFTRDAVFTRATFTRDAVFDEATFAGRAVFARATFTRDAVFTRATFTGDGGGEALVGARFAVTPGLTQLLPSGLRWALDDGSGWRTVTPTESANGSGTGDGSAAVAGQEAPQPPPSDLTT